MPVVHRLFYSRKSFMFPERQLGPHREWMTEVKFLDAIFPNGSAYTVGRVNGDHWLLYMTGPVDSTGAPQCSPVLKYIELPSQSPNIRSTADDIPATLPSPSEATPVLQDYTIEILMTHLGDHAREAFYTPSSVDDTTASSHGRQISTELGITDLFPRALTQLDAYSFTPCGYSSNALLKWGAAAAQDEDRVADIAGSPPTGGEGYYTIHVTPEKGWSYASFECNVPLPPASAHAFGGDIPDSCAETDTNATAEAPVQALPDLQTLIRRVVRIFQPGKITLTLFVSSRENEKEREEDADCESAVEAAQKAFRAALSRPLEFGIGSQLKTDDGAAGPVAPAVYRRSDKINYEFGGYDLAYASFELRS
jgi:S-adenosylmethionine decarboxylase